MKNSDVPNKKKDKKTNFIARYFEWVAKGTQKANKQGRGPCKS